MDDEANPHGIPRPDLSNEVPNVRGRPAGRVLRANSVINRNHVISPDDFAWATRPRGRKHGQSAYRSGYPLSHVSIREPKPKIYDQDKEGE